MNKSTASDPTTQAISRPIDWGAYDRLHAEGVSDREIERRWDIPHTSFQRAKKQRTRHGAPDSAPGEPTTSLQRLVVGEAVSAPTVPRVYQWR